MAFDLRAILEIMGARVPTLARVVLTGGLSRAPIMPRLLADVLGREVAVPDQSEGSIGGAAIIALHGAGLVYGLAFAGGPPPGHTVAPDPSTADLYERRFREHGQLVGAMRSLDLRGGDSPAGEAPPNPLPGGRARRPSSERS